MHKQNKPWNVIQGLVNIYRSHIKIFYGDQSWPSAMIQPGPYKTLILQLTADSPDHLSDEDQKVRKAILKEVDYYVFELNPHPDPWEYAIHHCTTAVNCCYSNVHWRWYPEGDEVPKTVDPKPELSRDDESPRVPENVYVRENDEDFSQALWPKLQQKVADHLVNQEANAEAIVAADAALKNDPLNPYTWYLKGLALIQMFQFDQAIEAMNQAAKYAPKRPEPYAERGYCYYQLDEPQKALEDLNRAIRLDVKDPYYREIRGRTHLYLGHFEAAIKDFTVALRYNKNDPGLLLSRARAYLQVGDLIRAERDFKKVSVKQPNNLLGFAEYTLFKTSLASEV